MEAISAHITYAESIASDTATKNHIDNTPSSEVLLAMKYVATEIFEKVRNHFGTPIKVSSFFRCRVLNITIGGAANSQHVKGEAIDMDGDTYGNPTNKQIFEFIKDNLQFDQLIIEGITDGKMAWVHCSKSQVTPNRNQILFMYKKDGKTIYEPYTHKRYLELVK